ncbi:hypothetical protein ACU686_05410 [Yinghuangia aomiensis]
MIGPACTPTAKRGISAGSRIVWPGRGTSAQAWLVHRPSTPPRTQTHDRRVHPLHHSGRPAGGFRGRVRARRRITPAPRRSARTTN